MATGEEVELIEDWRGWWRGRWCCAGGFPGFELSCSLALGRPLWFK
jgi:hypothetical protein